MKTLMFSAVAALALAGCAQTSGAPEPAGASAQGAALSSGGIEGLTLVFFRCDNNAAFTVQNYQNGSVRVTTSSGTRYDLSGRDGAYANDAVRYTRQGDTATLTGAAGGPYTNCNRSS